MKTIGEEIDATSAENDDGRETRAVFESLGVLENEIVIDDGTDAGAAIGNEAIKRENLTNRRAEVRIRRRRHVGRPTIRSRPPRHQLFRPQ